MHTGALAQQMEEQLMHEFVALLASRRKEGLAACSSSGMLCSSTCSAAGSEAPLDPFPVSWRGPLEVVRVTSAGSTEESLNHTVLPVIWAVTPQSSTSSSSMSRPRRVPAVAP